MSERAKSSLRAAFKIPDFRRVVIALAASEAGDWLYGTALIVYVYEQTGSPGWVAAAGIFRLAPYIFVGPFAGAIADRFDRRTVMIVSDLLRAGLMFALALFAAASAPAAIAVAIAFLATVAGTPFGPALTGLTPTIVEEKQLAAANAGLSTVEHTALVVGPALGGLILIVGPAWVAFAANGLTFLFSALMLSRIRSSRAKVVTEEASSLLRDLKEGIGAVTSSASVLIPVTLYAFASLAYGFQIVLFVLVAEGLLGMGAEGVGFLNAAIGVGGVAAAGFSSKMAEDSRSGRSLAIGVICFGLPIAVLALVRAPVVACLLIAVVGAGSIILDVVTVTLLQRLVDERVLARVFAILDSIAVGAILVGSLAAPLLVSTVGIQGTLVVVGLLVPLMTLALGPTIRRLDRIAEKRSTELAPVIEVLEQTGIFTGLSRPALERLALGAQRETVAPNTVVVAEGEPATDFYVVVTGQFEAETGRADERVVINTLGPHDYFGEIGLLEQIPRTASVRAAEHSEVLRISGDDFLEAVNQPATRSAALLNGVTARLARTHPSYEPASVTR